MTLVERLRAKLARKKEIEAAAVDGQYSAEEQQELDKILADCKSIKAQIDQEKEFEALENGFTQGPGRVTSPDPVRAAVPAKAKGPDSENTAGFDDVGDFAAAVHAQATGGHIDNRLYAVAGDGHNTNGGNGEGFLVPPAFSQRIVELALTDDSDLLGSVDSEPTSANQVEMLADESTPWSTDGVIAKWRSEGKKMKGSEISTDARDVKLHQLYAFTKITDELMEDAPRLANRLSVKAPEAIRWKLNEAIRYGTGAGQPMGYMNSKALVKILKESGQDAKTLSPENIVKMFSRMMPSSVSRAHWEINPELLEQLIMLKIGDRPIWTPPATGFANAPGGFLLGRPIKFTEHAKAIGTEGDIQFIDPNGYYMPIKQGGLKFAQSMHLLFDHGENALRWTFKAGGQTKLSKPVSPQHGTAGKSHFVTLAARG